VTLIVGIIIGHATTKSHERYGKRQPCCSEFNQRYNDRGMGMQWMAGPFGCCPMLGKGMKGQCCIGQPWNMRGPNPGNNMPCKCGCCNKPGNNDNRCGCGCGPNREGDNRMGFMPGPNPDNNMPCKCGCSNRPGNDDNKSGCKCGNDKKDGNKKDCKCKNDRDDDDDKEDNEDED